MTMPTEDRSNAHLATLVGKRIGLTVEEAAVALGISRALAYELVADGTLPSLRLRRRIIVPMAPLLRMFGSDSLGRGQDGHTDPAA